MPTVHPKLPIPLALPPHASLNEGDSCGNQEQFTNPAADKGHTNQDRTDEAGDDPFIIRDVHIEVFSQFLDNWSVGEWLVGERHRIVLKLRVKAGDWACSRFRRQATEMKNAPPFRETEVSQQID
nr:hypothetical protein [Chthoniobacter flavus]